MFTSDFLFHLSQCVARCLRLFLCWHFCQPALLRVCRQLSVSQFLSSLLGSVSTSASACHLRQCVTKCPDIFCSGLLRSESTSASALHLGQSVGKCLLLHLRWHDNQPSVLNSAYTFSLLARCYRVSRPLSALAFKRLCYLCLAVT